MIHQPSDRFTQRTNRYQSVGGRRETWRVLEIFYTLRNGCLAALCRPSNRGNMKPTLRCRLLIAVSIAVVIATASVILERVLHAAEPLHIYLTYSGAPETSIDINVLTPERVGAVYVHYDTVSHGGIAQDYAYQIEAPHEPALMEISDERALYVAPIQTLAPGTTYYFVVTDAIGTRSHERKFRTLPGSDKPFRFIDGGDMGVDESVAGMLRTAARTDPDFAIIGGDIAYENGLLGDYRTWDRWLRNWDQNMVTTDGRMVPIVTAIGNHETNDYESDELEPRAPWYIGLFGRQGPHVYWSFRVGDETVFYLLDSGHLVPHEGEQTDWLAAEMERYSNRRNQFAAYHVPLYPAHRPYEYDLSAQGRASWAPLFDAYDVDVAFEHHDHVFKRSKPLEAGEIDEGGTTYVGDGCFGHDTRTVDPHPRWYDEKERSVRHFWVVDVSRDELRVQAIGSGGDRIDEFTLPTT